MEANSLSIAIPLTGIFKTYGYGCAVNYVQALNWFERAAKLDDHRVSMKASIAADDLRKAMDYADTKSNEILDKFQQQIEH